MPVDNSCGEVCGECGKVSVFNRYPPVLPVENLCIPYCINREIRAHKPNYVSGVTGVLFRESCRKSWDAL
jgi:hypothetical protein